MHKHRVGIWNGIYISVERLIKSFKTVDTIIFRSKTNPIQTIIRSSFYLKF